MRVMLPKADALNRPTLDPQKKIAIQNLKEMIAEKKEREKEKDKEKGDDERSEEEWEDAELIGLHLLDAANSAVVRLMKGTTGWGMGWNGVLQASEEKGALPYWQDFRNLSCVAMLRLKQKVQHTILFFFLLTKKAL